MSFVVLGLVGAVFVAAFVPPRLVLWLLFLVCTVFNPRVSAGPVVLYSSAGLVGILLLSAFGQAYRSGRKLRITVDELDRVLILCYAYFVVNGFVQYNGSAAFKRILAMLLLPCMYFGLRNYLVSKKRLSGFLRLLGWSCVVASVYGIYTYYFSSFRGARMAMGGFGNPNHLGHFILISVVGLFLLFVNSTGSHKLVYGICLLLSGFVLLLTKSRTSIVACAVAAVYWVYRNKPRLFFVFLVALPMLCFWAQDRHGMFDQYATIFNISEIISMQKAHLVPLPFVGDSVRFSSTPWLDPQAYKSFPNSLGARYVVWGQAVSWIFRAPIFGHGPSTIQLSCLPFDSKVFNACFNQWLSVTLDFGLVGLVLFSFASIVAWRRTVQSRSSPDPFRRQISEVVAAAYLGQAVHFLAEDTLYAIMNNWSIGILLAISVALVTAWEEAGDEGESTEDESTEDESEGETISPQVFPGEIGSTSAPVVI